LRPKSILALGRGRSAARRALPDHAAIADVSLSLMYNDICICDSSLSSRMVAFMSRKSESKTEVAAARVPGQVQRLAVFGPSLLLEGEDAAAYDELLGRMCAAVKPVDVIYEMLIADVVSTRMVRSRWRASVPGMNRMLSIRSKYSPAST
jgi:hypothetical protein